MIIFALSRNFTAVNLFQGRWMGNRRAIDILSENNNFRKTSTHSTAKHYLLLIFLI